MRTHWHDALDTDSAFQTIVLYIRHASGIAYWDGLQGAIRARIDHRIDRYLISLALYLKLGFKSEDLEDTDQQPADVKDYLGQHELEILYQYNLLTTVDIRFTVVQTLEGPGGVVIPSKGIPNNTSCADDDNGLLVLVVEPERARSAGKSRPVAISFYITNHRTVVEEERLHQEREAQRQKEIRDSLTAQRAAQEAKRVADRKALRQKGRAGGEGNHQAAETRTDEGQVDGENNA